MAETMLIRRLANAPRLFDALRWMLEGGYRGHHQIVGTYLADCGRVLDLGCGTGIYAEFFSPESYLGVDISPEYITAARTKYPQYKFEVQDGQRVPFADDAFDACMISGVLHHLDDKAAGAMLSEAARVVRPGGRIVVWEDIPSPNWWNLVGHLIHRLDLGNYIRKPAGYAALLQQHVQIESSQAMRSGAMDYQVFVGTPLG